MNRLISAAELRKRIEDLMITDTSEGSHASAFNAGLQCALVEIALSDTLAFIDENDKLYRSFN